MSHELKNGRILSQVGLGGMEGNRSYVTGLTGVLYSEGCLTLRSIARLRICGGSWWHRLDS